MGMFALLTLGIAFAGAPTVLPGTPALQFTLPAINEDTAMELVNKPTVALSDFAGLDPAYPHKVTVLYFCTRKAGGDGLTTLEQVARRYKGKEVQIVAILAEPGEVGPLADWVGGLGLSFPVLRDHHRIVTGRYGLDDLPVTYIVDGTGEVYAAGNPRGGDLETELVAGLDALLQGAPTE